MPEDSGKRDFSLSVNGSSYQVKVYPMKPLLHVLREDLDLTGSKEGCGEGECGACSVFLDGMLVNSCLVPVGQVGNAKIATIEGVREESRFKALQESFVNQGGAQCGICTPGMIMASLDLLAKEPNPSENQIRIGLSGNLCRCTGYTKIFAAVKAAAANLRG